MGSSGQGCELPGLGPEAYARWRASDIGAITERLERALIIQLVGDLGGRKVLDVGCGDGELACELARRGAIVTGIDACRAMIEAARDRAKRQDTEITFEVARPSGFPSRPNSSTSSSP